MAFRKAKAIDETDTEHRLHRSISCFSFNKDMTQIALSPNDHTIQIFSMPSIDYPSDKWTLKYELEGHDSYVSGIDWSSVTNLLVSAGHDRNAYVWKFNETENKWIPTLVILRINRAANCVKWSPNGIKFSVGSSAKQVPVCHYEEGNNWWVSKMIKKHKSTILTVSWHPNSRFLLTGGCDYKCRIFSAFIKDVDSCDGDEFSDIFSDELTFGAILAEFDCSKGWIESVCWSPNGFLGAFVGHDSTVNFFQITKGTEKMITQRMRFHDLPFRVIRFVSNKAVIAAGHNCCPYLFVNNGLDEPKWEFIQILDKFEKAKDMNKTNEKSSFAASKALFQTSSTKGISSQLSPTVINTRHKNQIVDLFSLFPNPESQFCSELLSAGIDGRVLFWDLKSIVDMTKISA